MPDRPSMVRGYSNTSKLRGCKASRADQRSPWVRIVIHQFTAQSYADEMMNGSTEFTLSASEGLTDHEWNPRSQCLHSSNFVSDFKFGIRDLIATSALPVLSRRCGCAIGQAPYPILQAAYWQPSILA
jgi:hypothetical protein